MTTWGLVFAARLATHMKVDFDVSKLIAGLFEHLFGQLASNEQQCKAVKKLSEVLPKFKSALYGRSPAIYSRVKDGAFKIAKPRVVSEVIVSYERPLVVSSHTLVRSNREFFFSGEFIKPRVQNLAFNVRELVSGLVVGFAENF